jgi:DNA-binding transcriptional ArsR family regulator
MAKHSDMTEVLRVLKVLNHPVRLSILCNLIEKGEMSAGEIVVQEERLASQSQTSQYLKILKDEGLVTSRKEGQFVLYSLASEEVKVLIATLHELYCPAEC